MSLASTISSGDTIAHRLQPLSGPPVQTPLIEKLYIGLDQTPHSFNLREKVLGAAGANLHYISKETGVQISLRGIGSLYIEPNSNTELQEPLHLLLEHQRYENLNSAMELAKNLIETLHQEFRQLEIGTQVLSSPHIPTAQLNVPPLNVISSVPPPSVTAPLLQHQQISLVQHQFLPQNGLQMQLGQNAMIIQQQPPNFLPPPPPQSSLLPMKPTNQIQWQFHQPPPGMSTQHAPIILNTQPQGLQYQYVQQTTTRDLQGNQQITFQPIIQQTQIPMQSQQQYFTLQQGNTTYMIPQSSIFQQAPFGTHPSAQLSIIHQQATSLQHAPHLQVHLPPVNAPHTTPNAQTPPSRHEAKTDAHTDALPTSSSSLGLLDSGASVSVSHEDVVAEQVDGGTDQPNKLIVRNSPRAMPITSLPPPPINMSVPPPVQHFVGNHLLTGSTTMTSAMLPQQEMVPATPNVQPNSIRNSNSWQQARGPPPPPLGQTLTEVQQLQSIGQQQPFAMTFTQQPLQQQPTQQFVHLQQPQQQQTQFGVIQTSALNSVNAFQQQQILQLQQIQPQNALQMAQQQIHYSQQQLMQQQEKQQQIFYQLQQQMGEQAQIPMDSTSQAASFSRPGQKRRPANESVISSAGGPPPNQKVRAGVGSQSNMTNIAMTSASTGNASKMVEAGGVCGQGRSMNSSQCLPQNHQLLKPTHIGVMRYNQDPHKPVFDIAYPPPRGPRPAQHQTNQHYLAQQLKHQQLATNSCGQRMQIIPATQPPPLPASNVYSGGSAPR